MLNIVTSGSDKIFHRIQLFEKLNEIRNHYRILWIAAPAGYGKTTLITDYLRYNDLPFLWHQFTEMDNDIAAFFHYFGNSLRKADIGTGRLPHFTPEYQFASDVFARNFFQILLQDDKKQSILVFDDYHEIASDSGLHEIISNVANQISVNGHLIVISRNSPPSVFSRLIANEELKILDINDIKLTMDEVEEIARLRVGNKLSKDTLEKILQKTNGWLAGLILFLANTETEIPDNIALGEIFNYFAQEVFSKMPQKIQYFLLRTTFLPKITANMAEQLTGMKDSDKVLYKLYRDKFFISKTEQHEDIYQYHPLFREFLLFQAQNIIDIKELAELKRNAANILARSGQIEDAVNLLSELEEWEPIIALILPNASEMLRQGRHQTLIKWISLIPDKVIMDTPWLLYWKGMCRLAYAPPEARKYLEQAYFVFEKEQDVEGLFLSWAAIIDTFVYEWGDFSPLDKWIAILDDLLAVHQEFPSEDIEIRVSASMLSALTWRQPSRKDIPLWADNVKQIVFSHSDIQLRMMLGNSLVFYYLWCGDFSKASLIINTLRPISALSGNDKLTQQNWYVMQAIYSCFVADNTTCQQAISNGIENAEESGIHLLDLYLLGQGIYSGVSTSDIDSATYCLDKMSSVQSSRLLDRAFYHCLAASVAWYHGDLLKATEYGSLAVKLAMDSSCPLTLSLFMIDLSSTLFDAGQYQEADMYLSQVRQIGRGMNFVEFLTNLHGARFAFETGKDDEGVILLGLAFNLAAKQGYLNIPRWNNKVMSYLCAKALENNIETKYVQDLIKKRELIPATPVDNWPYQIKIYTSERLEIVIDGKPLEFSKKIAKKPIELLQAIISFGGRDVPEEKLSDLLWPDADGDMAHQSFATTLKRLRALLDNKEAIRLSGGYVSIDPRYCWVDTLAARSAK